MKILVTGGAGFIGSALVRYLCGIGAGEIVVCDNLYRGRRESLEPAAGIEFQHRDVRDAEGWSEAMRGVEVVFHLAAQANVVGSMADPDYALATNVAGTYHVLAAARKSGVRRVVFTSSREIYGDVTRLPVSEDDPLRPKNAYGASKAAGEMCCRVFDGADLEVVVLRLANVYGPGDRDRVIPLFVQRAAAGEPLIVYGEGKILDFVAVPLVVEALWQAAQRDVAGQVINIGSGAGTTLEGLAERVRELAGGRTPIVYRPARRFEVDRYVADVSRARALLGYTPPADPLYQLAEVFGQVHAG
jgi:nucleoside-diphosphate-sugar epimerase